MFDGMGWDSVAASGAFGIVCGWILIRIIKWPRSWTEIALVATVALGLTLLAPYVMTDAWLIGIMDASGHMSGIPMSPFVIGLCAVMALIASGRLLKQSIKSPMQKEDI